MGKEYHVPPGLPLYRTLRLHKSRSKMPDHIDKVASGAEGPGGEITYYLYLADVKVVFSIPGPESNRTGAGVTYYSACR